MTQHFSVRYWLPHTLVTLFFIIISLAYFYPILSGESLVQSDIVQYKGMQRQILEHRATYDEEPYWMDNAFVGMPTYQVTPRYPYDLLRYVDNFLRFLPRPADMLFLYLFFFYVFAQSRKFSLPVSVFGALAYGFSSYYIVILIVGHNTKAMALAYAPLVFLGLFQVLFDKKRSGFLWLTLGLALQLHANHLQMTYYTLVMVGLISLFWLVSNSLKYKINDSLLPIGKLLIAGLLALMLNAQSILATLEYTEFSMRGPSELTIQADGTPKDASSGLSFDYITEYSYGIFETWTFFAPNIMGGSSTNSFPMNSEFVQFLRTLDAETANTIFRYARPYWGNQPFVAAPVYLGIVALFFALIGLVVTKLKIRVVLLSIIAVSLLFSWGKNIPEITHFFIEYFPLYDKFRAVSSAQIMIMLVVPYAAMIGLNYFVKSNVLSRQQMVPASYVLAFFVFFSLFLVGGIKGFFSFVSANEPFAQYPEIMNPLVDARASLIWQDIYQLIMILVLLVLLYYAYWKKYIRSHIFAVGVSIVMLGDLWIQNRNYFDEEQFVTAYTFKRPFVKTEVDKQIAQDTSRYRVFEPSLGMANARTAYFHSSIGGYHGAKPAAIQEVYDFYLQQEDSIVLDLLNVKYVIDPAIAAGFYKRPSALGPAWLVSKSRAVSDANQEILSLSSINPREEAVSTQLSDAVYRTSDEDFIQLKNHRANKLEYTASVASDRLAIFSEMHYAKGWKAYIDGVAHPHYRVNYLLRGLLIPAGNHEIIFRFEPSVVRQGTILMVVGWLFLIGLIVLFFKRSQKIIAGV
jgi:hypothetical protein